jgi:hypothetical protein
MCVELNALFVRLSIKTKLQVFGLPSSSDVLRLRDEMTKGRISTRKLVMDPQSIEAP